MNTFQRTTLKDAPVRSALISEAVIVSHMDPNYMGTLTVELISYRGSNPLPERTGQLMTVRYLSPFYGVTPLKGVQPNDAYRFTQQSYGFWAIPPDVGTRVLVLFAEGHAAYGYWIGCIPDEGMNFMVPDPRAVTELTTDGTPENLKGQKLPTGEYNKLLENGESIDYNFFLKPYNKDFTEVLEVQGLLYDETRGLSTSSARREAPSMVFGWSSPGPKDKRTGSPDTTYGDSENASTDKYSRLGGSSIVMDDGDDKFVRVLHAADGPPLYVNKEKGEEGGDETIPQHEGIRIRTRTGHQILLSNSEDLIYIGNSRGTAWIELTSDGKIDVFADDSISLHSNNDINLSSDRDVNIEAGRNLNMKASARWSQGLPSKNGIDSGRIHAEAVHNYNLRVGRTSNFLNISEDTFNLKVDGGLNIESTRDMSILSAQNMYTTSKGSMHQRAERSIFRKAQFELYESSTNYTQEVIGEYNSLVTGSLTQEVGGSANQKIRGSSYTSIGDSEHKSMAGSQYLNASGNVYAQTGGSMNTTASGGMFSYSLGGYNIISSGVQFDATGKIQMNSGSAVAGKLASDGVVSPSSPTIFSGTSPTAATGIMDSGKLATITLPYIVPGTTESLPVESIVPRMPMHEPWPQHENMNPQMFKKEMTDRDRPGELNDAARVRNPDTFLKSTDERTSEYVEGTGGTISGYSGDSVAGGAGGPVIDYSGTAQLPAKNITARGVAPAGPAPSYTQSNCKHPYDVSKYLGTVTSKSGLTVQVALPFVDIFQGFMNELESSGYQIKTLGGYCYRKVTGGTGFSYHASGAAIDINAATNPYRKRYPGEGPLTDMPIDLVRSLCKKYGLGWGGDWNSIHDAMHFSTARSEGGAYDLVPGYIPISPSNEPIVNPGPGEVLKDDKTYNSGTPI